MEEVVEQQWNVPYKENCPVLRRISQTTAAAGANKAAQSKHYEEKLEIWN